MRALHRRTLGIDRTFVSHILLGMIRTFEEDYLQCINNVRHHFTSRIMLPGLMFLSSSLTICTCMPARITKRTIRGYTNKGSARFDVFPQFTSSQQLCREYYQPWWEEMLPKRMAADLKSIVGPLHNLVPPMKHYSQSPIQSTESKLSSRDKPSHVLIYRTRHCSTICEDQRSDLELFITLALDRALQYRWKGPIHMKCPKGSWAELVYEQDEREIPSAEERKMEVFLAEINLGFRRDLKGLFMQSGTRPALGLPVTRCVCIIDPKSTTDLAISAGESASSASACIEQGLSEMNFICFESEAENTLIPARNETGGATDLYHHSLEGPIELRIAVDFWLDRYPETAQHRPTIDCIDFDTAEYFLDHDIHVSD